MSPRERERLIRKLSRAFKNPPRDLSEEARKYERYEPMMRLEELGAVAPGMTKKAVRKLLGKPDFVDTDDPGYKDHECDLEWGYEISPVGEYFIGFFKGRVVFNHEHRESDGGPPDL